MLSVVDATDPFAELDRRQEEVLRQLDDLDRRIEQAIREFAAVQQDAAERFSRKAAADPGLSRSIAA